LQQWRRIDWAWHVITDPVGMIVQNLAFLVLVWIAAEDRFYAAHTCGVNTMAARF